MNKPAVFLPLLVALLLPGAVLADVHSIERIGTIGFVLTDLDPHDGITPRLTLSNAVTRAAMPEAVVDAMWGNSPDNFFFQIYAPTEAPRPFEFSWQNGASMDAHMSSLGRDQPWQQWIEGHGHVNSSLTSWDHVYSEMRSDQLHFDVTPNTGVTFYATVQFQGSVTPPIGAEDSLTQNGSMDLLIDGPDEFSPLGRDSDELVAALRESNGATASTDLQDQVHVSWLNRTAQTQTGHVSMDIWTDSSSKPAILPVPEPGQAPMLASGLMLLGWIAYRRQHAIMAA